MLSNKKHEKTISVFFLPNSLGHARLGLIISKRYVPLAVSRNSIRRLIKENFRKNIESFAPCDILFVIKNKINAEKHKINDILIEEWTNLKKYLIK